MCVFLTKGYWHATVTAQYAEDFSVYWLVFGCVFAPVLVLVCVFIVCVCVCCLCMCVCVLVCMFGFCMCLCAFDRV